MLKSSLLLVRRNSLLSARAPLVSRALILQHRCLSVNAPTNDDGEESQEEVDRVALQLSRLLRVLAIGWLGTKLWEIYEGSNTYLIAPSLTLVRSRQQENRESGVWRVNAWHSSETALEVVVSQGGAELLLAALPTAQPKTRGTILELLTKAVPIGDARTRLIASNAAERAAAGCAALSAIDAAEADRCQSLAAGLKRALEEETS